ncbi:Putative electron transport protein YccM [Fundidesulfovibrio magnetotacticus]|uniref:Electron transport protein YccM n=1 Tax=Fundidesulfovibrio magnetotacticus TaxID=2730080 RepID=A0A6V8LRD4_9BACT|nr:4Fe-4S binding protein [Fundidesulfovibrio magnetotacticus]GFK92689.1 Putative electron transport protein YccM [Fundidesulfovibrio magnetotacticus]
MPDAAANALPRSRAGFSSKAWRRASQALWLLLLGQWSFYGIFRCPFVVPFVSCQNCPVLTCHGRLFSVFWGFWALLPLSALLFGRAFCGWACPGGLVNQLLGMAAPLKARAARFTPWFAPAGGLIALAVCGYVWFSMGQPRANVPIRTGEFFQAVALTFEHADRLWIVRTAVVLGLTALGLGLANAWCRYACPMGAALESVKRASLFKVFMTPDCNGCDACRRVCEMGARPAETNCTNCADCLDACPKDAIRLGRKP